MSTSFPTSLDTLTNPASTDEVAVVSHSTQHANANDAIEALEAKVGINSSAVTTSHDYKLGEVTGSDKAVGKTATQTLTNKTLTAPVISTISNTGTLTLPTATDTLVGRATTDTLTNKTIDPSANTIDGDKLDITWNPANYTPTDVAETDDVDDLSAHLKGIDLALAAVSASSMLTFIPPVPFPDGAADAVQLNANTTAHVTYFNIPTKITVNKISIAVSAVGASGTLDVGVFSEDGQTQKISVTTGSISGTGITTVAVSAVELAAGNYWLVINPNTTADISIRSFVPAAASSGELVRAVTGEPDLAGRLTIVASTMPATITPANIDGSTEMDFVIFRLDN